MSNIDKYINGSDEYAEVLRIVRQHLRYNLPTKYGAIAFYKFDQNAYAKVKVFPVDPEIVELHFPDDTEIREKVLMLINMDRNYEEFYQLKTFRDKFNTTEHFDFSISKKNDLLEHSKDCINEKAWLDFVNEINKYNILDQLYYASNESKYKAIPLPILYSPAILIVVPKDDITTAEKIDKVVASVAESVHFYLFNRLLTELSNDVRLEKIGTDKQELIQEFLSQLAEVAIPIKYEFNGKEYQCFDWYGSWKTNSSAIIELTLADETVKMYMPTFCWHDGKMLHEKDEYRVREQQVKETIENIFKLIHSNWKAVNDTKRQGRYVLKQIVEDSGLNLNALKLFSNEIYKIKNAVERAVNISDEDYAKTLGAVASKEVKFQKTYNDGKEIGYKVFYGGKEIVNYTYPKNKATRKTIKHFGYDVLREIIERNGKIIEGMGFSFVEEVRRVLPTKDILRNGKQNGQKSALDDDNKVRHDNDYFAANTSAGSNNKNEVEDAISTVMVLVEALDNVGINKSNINSMKYDDFISKRVNVEGIKEIVSKQKKDIDQLKQNKANSSISYKKNDETMTLTTASMFINTLHKYFIDNIHDYRGWHKTNGTTDVARGLRQNQTNEVRDSDITQRIADNLSQLCNRLITHNEHGTIFKSNFTQAELNYDKSNRKFKYDKTKIDIGNTLEWIFE